MPSSPTFRIAAIVTVTVIGAMSLGGLYLLGEARQNETAKLERAVNQAWTLGRLGKGGTTLEDLVAVGRRMAEKTPVLGGIVRDETGKEVARFGEVPEPDPEAAAEPTMGERLYGAPTLDIELHDAAHDIRLVVDAGERSETLRRATASVLGLSLVIASLVGAIAAWLSEIWVSRPQRQVADLLADPTPEKVREVARRWKGGSSSRSRLGAAAATMAGEYLVLADAGLKRTQTLVDNYPHPIVVFTLDGELESANRSALRLFAAGDLEELRAQDPINLFRTESGNTVAEVLERGARLGPAKAQTPRGDLPGLLAFDRLRDPDGGEDRIVATFVDLRAAPPDAGASGDVRVGRLSATLESCLTLIHVMSGDDEAATESVVDLGLLAEGWRDKSVDRGLIERLTWSGLPVVAGRRTSLERVLDCALNVVRSRSGSLQPELAVEGRVKDNSVVISVSESGDGPVASGADAAIPMAALTRLLARDGGSILAAGGAGQPNRLSLSIACNALPAEASISRAA